jgi:hypothetical protein
MIRALRLGRAREYNPDMSTLQPEQALFLREGALRSLKTEQPITQRVIEAIPIGKGDYRPDDIGKTAMELAWHIVAPSIPAETVIDGAFDTFGTAGRPIRRDRALVRRNVSAGSRRLAMPVRGC